MFKIAICDDDRKYIQYLRDIIQETRLIDKNKLSFYEFTSGERLLYSLDKEWDLVIMDMQMGGINGYETAQKLREYDKKILLVFCSGVYQPNSESFKVTPFRYLQKNFPAEKMRSEMREILEEMVLRAERPSIMCKFGPTADKIRVYSDSILYVAIKNEATQIYICGKLKKQFGDEPLRSGLKINEVCEIFGEKCGFSRIHNSYAVNMNYVMKTGKESLIMEDGTELTISRARSKEFKMAFTKYMSAKYKGAFHGNSV